MSQPQTPPQPKPWEQKQISRLALFGVRFGIMFGLIIAVTAWIGAIALGVSLLRDPSLFSSEPDTLMGFSIFAVLALISTVALIFLFPLNRREANFTPSYGQLPAVAQGLPFEVRFQRYLWGRSFRGAGVAQFSPEGLSVSGYMEPHALLQIGVVLVVTILPLAIFGIGLGIIPALLIAYYMGRKQLTNIVPYTAMHDLEVKGSKIIIRTEELPKRIIFSVSANDGERLYNELKQRFPQAMQNWQG